MTRLSSALAGAAVVLVVFGVGAFVLSRPGPGGDRGRGDAAGRRGHRVAIPESGPDALAVRGHDAVAFAVTHADGDAFAHAATRALCVHGSQCQDHDVGRCRWFEDRSR